MKQEKLTDISNFLESISLEYRYIVLIDKLDGTPVNSILLHYDSPEEAIQSITNHAQEWLTSGGFIVMQVNDNPLDVSDEQLDPSDY